MEKDTYKTYFLKIVSRHLFSITGAAIILGALNQQKLSLGLFAGGVLAAIVYKFLFDDILAINKLSSSLFFFKYIISYSLIGLFLFIAFKRGLPVFVGMVVGLFGIKLQILLNRFYK